MEAAMESKNKIDAKSGISHEKALEILYKLEETYSSEVSIFDEYGNFFFPTDLVIDTPNTAIGTPLGLSLIDNLLFLES